MVFASAAPNVYGVLHMNGPLRDWFCLFSNFPFFAAFVVVHHSSIQRDTKTSLVIFLVVSKPFWVVRKWMDRSKCFSFLFSFACDATHYISSDRRPTTRRTIWDWFGRFTWISISARCCLFISVFFFSVLLLLLLLCASICNSVTPSGHA